jgi:hypothetical protein
MNISYEFIIHFSYFHLSICKISTRSIFIRRVRIWKIIKNVFYAQNDDREINACAWLRLKFRYRITDQQRTRFGISASTTLYTIDLRMYSAFLSLTLYKNVIFLKPRSMKKASWKKKEKNSR